MFNSEYKPMDYIVKAAASGFPLEDYYIRGLLRVFSIQYPGELTREAADMLASRLRVAIQRLSSRYGFFVIDSISYFGSVATPSLLNELVVTLRDTASSGKGVVVTVHTNSLPAEVMRELAASADGYLRVTPAVIGGRRLKVLSVVKLRGAPPGIESTITFDVDPAFGIKLVPIMISQA